MVIPEIILQRVIVNGLRAIRKDTRVLDALFVNLDQVTLQAIKDFITQESIHFTLNYPREDTLHTPSIVLLLKNENEAQTFLGDVMGAAPYYDMPDQELTIDTLGGHGASTSGLSGLPRKLIGPLKIINSTYDAEMSITTVFLDPIHYSEMSELLEFPSPSSDLYVVGGAGAGQMGEIINFRTISLDIDGKFDTLLDSSSLVDIRVSDTTGLAVGEPSRVYPAGATNLLRKGANYETQYQLSIIAGHQDGVLYLYSVIKALLFSQKAFMEGQGLMALKISGSDFAPRTEFLPSEIFQRVMTLQFTYPFTFLEEIEVFDIIRVDLTPANASTAEACGTIQFDVMIGDDDG